MKRASLGEIMGRSGAQASEQGSKLKLSALAEILGDAAPELPRNSVGRFRLIRALRNRYGNSWRTLPGVTDLVKEFDGEVAFEKKIAQIKAVKVKGGKRG